MDLFINLLVFFVFSLYKILPSEELVEVVAEVTEVALVAVAALEAVDEVVTGGGLEVVAVEGLGVPSEDLFSLESCCCCCLEGVEGCCFYYVQNMFSNLRWQFFNLSSYVQQKRALFTS